MTKQTPFDRLDLTTPEDLHERYTFKNFFKGTSNEEALQATRDIAAAMTPFLDKAPHEAKSTRGLVALNAARFPQPPHRLLSVETDVRVGEERRFVVLAQIQETASSDFLALPKSIREIGGGINILHDRPEHGQPINGGMRFNTILEANDAIKRWAWAFIETEAPIHR